MDYIISDHHLRCSKNTHTDISLLAANQECASMQRACNYKYCKV